jgi:hypothetical protein
MARYKDYCYEQGKMMPISFRDQILPGTFEHTLSYQIDHELDLSIFDQRYSNDDTGRPAYDFFCGEFRKPETFTQTMKRKIDSLVGKAVYHRRIATVEPVFGHLRTSAWIALTSEAKEGRCPVEAVLYCA